MCATRGCAHAPCRSEPWIIGDRLRLPWHDARYRGYGLNKQQFVAHVNATGWRFRVMYDAFTVHRWVATFGSATHPLRACAGSRLTKCGW